MLIGAGITLHTCLATADILAQDGIAARVIDTYSIKPIDGATLAAAAASTAGRIVVAEDHHPEGGLGSAVIDSLIAGGVTGVHLAHLAVREMPGSEPANSCSPGPESTPTTSQPPPANSPTAPARGTM